MATGAGSAGSSHIIVNAIATFLESKEYIEVSDLSYETQHDIRDAQFNELNEKTNALFRDNVTDINSDVSEVLGKFEDKIAPQLTRLGMDPKIYKAYLEGLCLFSLSSAGAGSATTIISVKDISLLEKVSDFGKRQISLSGLSMHHSNLIQNFLTGKVNLSEYPFEKWDALESDIESLPASLREVILAQKPVYTSPVEEVMTQIDNWEMRLAKKHQTPKNAEIFVRENLYNATMNAFDKQKGHLQKSVPIFLAELEEGTPLYTLLKELDVDIEEYQKYVDGICTIQVVYTGEIAPKNIIASVGKSPVLTEMLESEPDRDKPIPVIVDNKKNMQRMVSYLREGDLPWLGGVISTDEWPQFMQLVSRLGLDSLFNQQMERKIKNVFVLRKASDIHSIITENKYDKRVQYAQVRDFYTFVIQNLNNHSKNTSHSLLFTVRQVCEFILLATWIRRSKTGDFRDGIPRGDEKLLKSFQIDLPD